MLSRKLSTCPTIIYLFNGSFSHYLNIKNPLSKIFSTNTFVGLRFTTPSRGPISCCMRGIYERACSPLSESAPLPL